MAAVIEEILVTGKIPEQKHLGSGAVFPFVVIPGGRGCRENLLRGIKIQKAFIQRGLQESCAVLFRGFQLEGASDFNEVLEALGYDNFAYSGRGQAKKPIIGERVFTASEAPLHLKIGFHNEMAYQLRSPSKICFFCEVPPSENAGGSTPIVLGHEVHDRLVIEMPKFLEKVKKLGLTYTKCHSSDPSKPDSWQAVFKASSKEEAEQAANAGGTQIQWNPDGTVTTFMGPRDGIKFDTERGRHVWFNNIGSTFEPPGQAQVTFGDGSPLLEEDMAACARIMEEEQVAFKWRQGDLLLLDNTAVLHARQSSKPPRKILAALCAN